MVEEAAGAVASERVTHTAMGLSPVKPPTGPAYGTFPLGQVLSQATAEIAERAARTAAKGQAPWRHIRTALGFCGTTLFGRPKELRC